MQELKERIQREGKVLPGNIVKVDGFLNHRVDCQFMAKLADEFAKYFDVSKIDLILTAEASGIALAAVCAYRYGIPMVFAKKAKSDNIEGGLYCSEIYSYTYKKKVTLLVSKEWIHPGDRVLIVDDFLARGEAMRGLCEIVQTAGAELVGIACAVEKGFQHGGDKLRESGVQVKSLAIIENAEPGKIEFREDD
jgi:xanthine phosphoribosyltransferase